MLRVSRGLVCACSWLKAETHRYNVLLHTVLVFTIFIFYFTHAKLAPDFRVVSFPLLSYLLKYVIKSCLGDVDVTVFYLIGRLAHRKYRVNFLCVCTLSVCTIRPGGGDNHNNVFADAMAGLENRPATAISISTTAATLLPRQFFFAVKDLLDRLDSPSALGRACVAAVSAPLPSLEDVRMLLEVRTRCRQRS